MKQTIRCRRVEGQEIRSNTEKMRRIKCESKKKEHKQTKTGRMVVKYERKLR